MRRHWFVIAALLILLITLRINRLIHLLLTGSWSDRLAVLIAVVVPVAVIVAPRTITRLGLPRSRILTDVSSDVSVRRGIILISLLVLSGIVAPLITLHDPRDTIFGILEPPSLSHWLGTDDLGRDLLSRLLYGARASLSIALIAVSISVIVGCALGMVAALSRGSLDTLLMRLVDAGLAFPRTFLLLGLLAIVSRVNFLTLAVILGLTGWFDIARIVRAEVLALREREFVLAATGLGLAVPRMLRRHILPNVAGPLLVSVALSFGYIILIESGLSYLGVGLRAGTPSWGKMMEEGYTRFATEPRLTLIPGAFIALTVIAFSLLGDGIRKALDPRRP
jgi:peptide/nickel transport system permease protein